MLAETSFKSFVDVFKKSFLESTSSQISIGGIIAIMLASLLLGAYIYIIYKKCFVGVVYSRNFNISVSMMCVITAMIVSTITSNIALSLGMVGALSIVRFRTAIKDPVDLIFLFWAVAGGISVGARLWYMALIGNILVGVAFIILTKIKRNEKTYLVVVRYADTAEKDINETLTKIKHVMRSKISKEGHTEMTIEIKVKKGDTSCVEPLKEVNGVDSVSMISYNGDFAQ